MNDEQLGASGTSPPAAALPLVGREDRRTGLGVDALKRAMLEPLQKTSCLSWLAA